MAEQVSILKAAVLKAYDEYFKEAVTDADYMNGVMGYYKKNLVVMRLAIGGLQNELNRITLKYKDYTDDEHVKAWAREIKALFAKKKAIKNPDFNPIEYLAVTYIGGHHGAATWANL